MRIRPVQIRFQKRLVQQLLFPCNDPLLFVIPSGAGFPAALLSSATPDVVLFKENHTQPTEAAALDRKSREAEGSAVRHSCARSYRPKPPPMITESSWKHPRARELHFVISGFQEGSAEPQIPRFAPPDFLLRLVALANFMRLSLRERRTRNRVQRSVAGNPGRDDKKERVVARKGRLLNRDIFSNRTWTTLAELSLEMEFSHPLQTPSSSFITAARKCCRSDGG